MTPEHAIAVIRVMKDELNDKLHKSGLKSGSRNRVSLQPGERSALMNRVQAIDTLIVLATINEKETS